DSERTNFEQAARADGSVNFQLTEMGPARELVPANRRGEYVPAYFLEPREANERALGFDTASDPLRGEALARARDTGEAAATGPITLVQETGREIGCVVYLPVYENDLPHDTLGQRRQHLRGYAAEVFRIADMMERSLHGLERSGLQIRLSDQSAPEREQLLFGPPEDVHPAQKPAFQRVTPLPMAGRDWSLQ